MKPWSIIILYYFDQIDNIYNAVAQLYLSAQLSVLSHILIKLEQIFCQLFNNSMMFLMPSSDENEWNTA